jgi:glycosyltransferase involved in cell wall biosynthesis
MTSADKNLPRTLFVCGGTAVYGFERVILRYLEGLHRRGFPLYCTISGWNDEVFPREIASIGVPFEPINLGWIYWRKPRWTMDTLRHLPGAVRAFRRVMRQFKPDLLVHSGYRSMAMLTPCVGSRNVIAVQDYWSKTWEHALVRALDHKVLAYIACSDDIARHLTSIGLSPAKIVRIYNPMSFADKPPAKAPSEGPVVFGIVGQIIERKGHHVVIDAMARMRRRVPTAQFVLKIFGNGNSDYITRLMRQAADLGIDGLIEWCGYRNHGDEYYPQLDCVLVMSTEPDPCPLAAIESGAYSLPAITSNCGGLAELVNDGETGFVVAPDDLDGLIDRMVTIITDPSRRRRMGEQAFWANKRRFDAPLVLEELVAMLNSIAKP